MLIRLIADPADEHWSGANQMRQWLSFPEAFQARQCGLSPCLPRRSVLADTQRPSMRGFLPPSRGTLYQLTI
jgi:hypothetical protein